MGRSYGRVGAQCHRSGVSHSFPCTTRWRLCLGLLFVPVGTLLRVLQYQRCIPKPLLRSWSSSSGGIASPGGASAPFSPSGLPPLCRRLSARIPSRTGKRTPACTLGFPCVRMPYQHRHLLVCFRLRDCPFFFLRPLRGPLPRIFLSAPPILGGISAFPSRGPRRQPS